MKKLLALLLLFPYSLSFGQVSTVDSLPKENLNWYNLSPKNDKIQGVGVDRAYSELLKDKKSKKTIVVAIIDAGVDINHDDLSSLIWVNENEIAGNGKDDDNNGYIDDINGWNFLGNSKGENINEANLELTRIVRNYSDQFEGKTATDIPEIDKVNFDLYSRAKNERLEIDKKYTAKAKKYEELKDNLSEAETVLKKELKKEELSLEDVQNFSATDSVLLKHKSTCTSMYTRGVSVDYLEGIVEYFETYTKYYTNLDFNPRAEIIGEIDKDLKNNNYGNSEVKGADAMHGSFVAGIIGGIRGNGIGIEGIADNVRFMVLRAVPNGDEHDKDIAHSIRYAVDNGANIINMSFGKYYSPYKSEVNAAVKYAASKGVLMIKASGNDETNIDKKTQYPNPITEDGSRIPNWITVGANNQLMGKKLSATFSNYGIENVHIYAPGVGIISTVPDSQYDMANGTSFACPVVSGVAALVWSYYPELTVGELKEILLSTGTNYKKKKVYQPGYTKEAQTKTKFGKLSSSGSIVNAYNALFEAEIIVKEKARKVAEDALRNEIQKKKG